MRESDQTDYNLAYQMTIATGGDSANIYNYESGYDEMMDLAVKYSIAKSSSVKLTHPAIVSSITVEVDGVKNTNWEYDSAEQSILFEYSSMPSQNANVKVTYSYLQ